MKNTAFAKMMKKLAAAFFCAAAVASSVPAFPSYAKPRTTLSASSEGKMRDAAGDVQAAFDQQDLKKLASLCAYPLTFTDADGNTKKIKTRKEFLALGSQAVFTQNLLNDVASANTAKIPVSSKGELTIGGSNGVVMKKGKGKWKVIKIYMEGSSAPSAGTAGIAGDMAYAAEQFQKTFYYRDLETLSATCSYPLKIYFSDGSIQEVADQKQLMDLGEAKVFPDELVETVNRVDVTQLKEAGGSVLVGDTAGFYMNKAGGTWKISLIFQE